MQTPDDLWYTDEHEWLRDEGDGKYRIGITDFAQDQLGDVVFVDLPDTGRSVTAGEAVAEVESTKSVAEIYAPIAGVVLERNDALVDAPDLVNRDPYGAAWFLVIEAAGDVETGEFMDAAGYQAFSESG